MESIASRVRSCFPSQWMAVAPLGAEPISNLLAFVSILWSNKLRSSQRYLHAHWLHFLKKLPRTNEDTLGIIRSQPQFLTMPLP